MVRVGFAACIALVGIACGGTAPVDEASSGAAAASVATVFSELEASPPNQGVKFDFFGTVTAGDTSVGRECGLSLLRIDGGFKLVAAIGRQTMGMVLTPPGDMPAIEYATLDIPLPGAGSAVNAAEYHVADVPIRRDDEIHVDQSVWWDVAGDVLSVYQNRHFRSDNRLNPFSAARFNDESVPHTLAVYFDPTIRRVTAFRHTLSLPHAVGGGLARTIGVTCTIP